MNIKKRSEKFFNSRERGIALVITLILLSIITFMTVTFMVISQHAKNQVSATTQQLIAQQAAQAAFDQAEARIMAQMIAQTNGFNFGPVVSTNFQSPSFDPTQLPGTLNVANVNYYDKNGVFLLSNTSPAYNDTTAYLQMLNNQLVLPRPPVFVVTNKAFPPEFRNYLDLNRNGIFDPSGGIPEIDQFGNTNFYSVIGDPEWIGILQHPDQPHSRSNLYIARYCFFAVPIGNSLDINYIHNQAKQLGFGVDGFSRDQGVAPWEINLAGFLYALNPNVVGPNVWTYGEYNSHTPFIVPPTPPYGSLGTAFGDAASIAAFRYNGSYNNLAPFPAPALFTPSNQIDYFSVGAPVLPANNRWSGSDNLNHLFTLQDWFSQPMGNVSNILFNAGRAAGAFNEYIYYRMLAQLGTDSTPEPTNKLHLNYKNVGGFVATNFISWADPDPTQPATNALTFFTNAADRLLGAHTNFVVDLNVYVTNLSSSFIPVYPVNYYTPAVHRMLQLAANIYDATLNKSNAAPFDFDYPSVFRPTFAVTNIAGVLTVFVNGYIEVGTNAYYNIPALSLPQDLPLVVNNPANINLYSVPWVIGAKKGFPNFNQISMQSYSSLSRKAQITKPTIYASQTTYQTNIQYVIGISNLIGVQAWNSYMPTFNRPQGVTIYCKDSVSMTFTNEYGIITNLIITNFGGILGPVNNWPGYPGAPTNVNRPSLVQASFKVPMYTLNTAVPGLIYTPDTRESGLDGQHYHSTDDRLSASFIWNECHESPPVRDSG